MFIELSAKRWISIPLRHWFHQENNESAPTTDVLVKFSTETARSPEQAKQQFRDALAKLPSDYKIEIIDDHVYVKNKNPDKPYLSVYARLSAPRYMEFKPAVHALATEGIHIRKIAGQDHVQVKCELNAPDKSSLARVHEALLHIKKAELMYTYQDNIHSTRKFCLFDVSVSDLHQTLTQLEEPNESTIKFIHNF